MHRIGNRLQIADEAKHVRALHDDAGGFVIDQLDEILFAARQHRRARDFAGEIGDGFHRFRIMRVQAAGENGLAPLRHPLRHQHGFGGGSGAVVQRRVCHFHSGEQRDLRLEFEQVLQCALRQLGLIRGVGGQELAALDQVIDRGRNVVAIGAAAEKERHRAGDGVFSRHRGEAALDLEFAHRTR